MISASIPPAPFYITTAIDYPNGDPHLGHAYEKIITDCYARWYSLLGQPSILLTGTDENGQKLIKSAESAGRPTQQFVDENVIKFRKLCMDLHIHHQDFVRTSEKRHHEVVQNLWTKMQERGDIYLGRYSGNYCISCETFYAESQTKNGQCPVHETGLSYMEEDGYFFKLSSYQDWIIEHISNQKEFIFPSSVRNEILSRLRGEKVHDLSISRPNQGWGIAVPNDPKHVIYTWFDALITYYTGAQIDEKNQPRTLPWWPASVHVIGKDISWFHSVIWPCMLKSAGLELPKQIYVHGMVLGSDGKRMSKSLGNGVDPQDCLKNFAVDSIRYYMLKNIPSGQDGAFSTEDLTKTHNSDLANELGNLLMRVLKLSQAQLGKEIRPRDDVAFELSFLDEVRNLMDQREHSKALHLIWTGVRRLNAYINQEEPWKKKHDLEAFHAIMYTALLNLKFVCGLLIPFIPDSATKALTFLGVKSIDKTIFDFKKESMILMEGAALFPRIVADED